MSKIGLKKIVGWFLDGKDYGPAEYRKAYAIAIRGWKILNQDVTGALKTIPVDVEANATACIPDEVISIVKVGVLTECGEYAALTEDNNLAQPVCADAEYEIGEVAFWPEHNHNPYPGLNHSLGVGSHHSIGRYRLMKGSNLIIFPPDFCYSQILLEATVNEKINGDYVIDELASEALLAFIRWQWAVDKNTISMADKFDLKQEWLSEKKDARYRLKKPLRQVMGQNARQFTKMGLKS